MSDIGKNFLSAYMESEEAAQQAANEVVEPEKPEVVEPVSEEVTEDAVPAEEPKDVVEGEPEPAGEEVVEQPEAVEGEPQEVTTPELNEDTILAYLKEKRGAELASLDDLFKEPEKPTDPFSGLPEKTQQFLKFNKETGRDYDDFLKLDTDYSKMTPLQKAQQKAIEFSDGELTASDVNEFLEKELNIDLSDLDELEKFDLIKLKGYAKDWEKQKLQEQETYKQPIEKVADKDAPEMIPLDNGAMVTKEQYDTMVNQRNQYLQDVKAASDNIKASVFQIKFDDNGTERTLDLSYDYSKEEVRNMAESAMDIDKTFKNLFGNENGIDYKELQEGLFYAKRSNREKAFAAVIHKARAEWTKESIKDKTNANFSTKKMPNNGKQVKTAPIPGTQQNYGVKFGIEQFNL